MDVSAQSANLIHPATAPLIQPESFAVTLQLPPSSMGQICLVPPLRPSFQALPTDKSQTLLSRFLTSGRLLHPARAENPGPPREADTSQIPAVRGSCRIRSRRLVSRISAITARVSRPVRRGHSMRQRIGPVAGT